MVGVPQRQGRHWRYRTMSALPVAYDPRALLDLLDDMGLLIVHPKQMISRETVAKLLGCCENTVDNRLDAQHRGFDPDFPKKRLKGENSVGWVAGEVLAYIDGLPHATKKTGMEKGR